MVVDRVSMRVLAALSAAGLCAISFLVTLDGSDSGVAELEALGRALLVAASLGTALYLWGRPPFDRFAWMLAVVGVGWFLTTLAGSDGLAPLQHRPCQRLGLAARGSST